MSAAGEQMPGYNDDPERAFRDKTGKDFCCEDIQSVSLCFVLHSIMEGLMSQNSLYMFIMLTIKS